MSKAENSCPSCGCPTEIVQCTDGTIEECRDISCPWSRDNGQARNITLRIGQNVEDRKDRSSIDGTV